ncbi:MAG: hypothetical protein M1825_000591 [Sarcosagium campestre]|nr:MAG: hypothetical protein M1825_000591 [Sarcosagium campestre]
MRLPIPLPEEPSLSSQDVTIIIPTLDGDGAGLRETVSSCLATEPQEILLVTIDANLKKLSELARSMNSPRIRIFSVAHANKRRQMCRAIPEVTTKITIFADDDISWPRTILPWILAPFETDNIGGVGTCQRLRRPDRSNVWDFLGALYLERRNFEISATTHLDGGISCLSGRTVAYRTLILQDPAFTYGFTHEYWLRSYQLNADDDNFITRWMLSHGWKTHVQYHKEAELSTTLEGNPKFLKQCLRWSRSNWRSNLTSMLSERYIWRKQPWSAYALHLSTLWPGALVGDFLLTFLCYKATEDCSDDTQALALALLGFWMFMSKFLKLIGHFIRYPEDVLFFPVSIAFGYLHGFIKAYAFLTLNVISDQHRMHRIRSWARSKAHASGYNPFAADGQRPAILPLANPNTKREKTVITKNDTNDADDKDAAPIVDVTHNNVADERPAVLPPPAPPPAHVDAAGETSSAVDETELKTHIFARFFQTSKMILFSSWLNVLLIFVPVGIAVEFTSVSPTIVFALNAIAIVPLAGLLSYATESVARRMGDTVGALMNITFGNAVELIILYVYP